jgi:mannose-6-phosphate isomerase-like protein (cupin superfamily)
VINFKDGTKRVKPFKVNVACLRKYRRLLGDSGKGINLRSGLVVLAPGVSVGRHCTTAKEEAIVFLEGRARFYYGQKSFLQIKAPAFIYVPKDVVHDIKNIANKPLKYIYITTAC